MEESLTYSPGMKTMTQTARQIALRTANLNIEAIGDSLDSLFQRVPFLVRRMVQISDSLFEEMAAEHSLTLAQSDILTALKFKDGLGQFVLGEVVGLDPSNTAAIVRRLTAAKLVRRRNDPGDARRKLVSLTPAGRKTQETASRLARVVSKRVLSPLNGSEQKCLLRALTTIAGLKVKTASKWTPLQASFQLYRDPCFLFRRVQQVTLARLHDANRENSITARQYAFLVIVQEFPLIDQTTLVEFLGLDRSTIMLVADNLEKRNLLTRTSDPHDRRKNLLIVTNTGKQLLPVAGKNNAKVERELLQELRSDDAQQIKPLLRRLVVALNGAARAPLALPEGFSA